MNYKLAESFILPRTSLPQDRMPVWISVWIPPVFESTAETSHTLLKKRERQINWDKVLGWGAMLIVSTAAWVTAGLAISYLWK